MKTNFIIADDHPIFIKGLKDLITEHDLGQVVAEVNNGKDLLQKLNSAHANFIILDINMPNLNGLEASRLIRENRNAIPILIVSMNEEHMMVDQLKKIGVNGFISKSFENNDLIDAIQKIIKGENYFPQKAQHHLDHLNGNKITNREKDIINLIISGKSTKDIAEILFLSPFTIDTHRKNIGRKTGAKTALQLIKFIQQNPF